MKKLQKKIKASCDKLKQYNAVLHQHQGLLSLTKLLGSFTAGYLIAKKTKPEDKSTSNKLNPLLYTPIDVRNRLQIFLSLLPGKRNRK